MSHPVTSIIRFERATVATISIYAMMLGCIDLVVPLAIQSVINSVSATGLVQPVIVLTTSVWAALVIAGLLYVAGMSLGERVVVRYFSQVAQRFAHVEDKRDARKFYDVVSAQKAMAALLGQAPAVALQLIVGLTLLSVYHPYLFVLVSILIAMLATYVMTFREMGEKTAAAYSSEKHAVAKAVMIGADGHREAVERYEQSRARWFAVIRRQTLASYLMVSVMSSFFLAMSTWLLMRGELSLGQLVAAELVIALIAQSTIKLPKLLEHYYELSAATEKIDAAAPGDPPPLVSPPRPFRVLARALVVVAVTGVFALIAVPWVQTAFTTGKVIVYAPSDRQQNVEAPIDGRVVQWHVSEGQRVAAGDPLVDLTDNDPEILQRLRAERDAVERRLDATRNRTLAIEQRISSLGESRNSASQAASLRVNMAKQRIVSAQRALDAAQANTKTTEANLNRQKNLAATGLASARTLELTDLDHQRAVAERDRAEAALAAARDELASLEADQRRVLTDASALVSDARASLGAGEAELASASAELARMDVRLARQSTQAVKAPRDGIVHRIAANAPGSTMVKSGDLLAVLVPDTADRAVELWASGVDAPLVGVGQRVRLQFEGWPAVQFSGWPSVAVGTFAGKVTVVDPANADSGKLRIIVTQDDEQWPDPRYLRQGVRAHGWVLLGTVRLGYELWRRINGFAPSLPEAPTPSEKA